MSELNKSSSILIVGGGTWGSSTALELARRGYSDIRILDVYSFPSTQSAGNDLNKITADTSSEPIYAQASKDAQVIWQTDDVYKPYYHPTGLLQAGLARDTTSVDSDTDILRLVPVLSPEKIRGWKGTWSPQGGWLAASQALSSVGREMIRLGVKTSFGPSGTMKEPILSDDGTVCLGVETIDGSRHLADQVILATGAWSPTLVDLRHQCVSKCWVLAHIQLDPKEVEKYKGTPVVYNPQLGFFFEPDSNGIIKVCDEFPGFQRKLLIQPFGASAPSMISVPRSHAAHPNDTYPDISEDSIRRAVVAYLPEFKDRDFVYRAMCWCTDTADSHWLICKHPNWKNLLLATGDSGHGFAYMPMIGKYVADLLEGKLEAKLAHAWRWRPDAEGDAESSTRGAIAKDLNDLTGWNHDKRFAP